MITRYLYAVMWTGLIVHLLLFPEILSVAVTEIRLLSDSNKTEYALDGEGATLTCHFVLNIDEIVTSVRWKKEGREVYIWKLNQQPVAMGIFYGKVDLTNRSPSTIYINKVHMDMHGKYTCKVQTNGKSAENDFYLTVIVDACKESSWKTHTDMITCTERVSLKCTGMFPKPSPACGIYNEQTGNYFTSVPFDRVLLSANRTYDITFSRWYNVRDWLNYTDITFRCYVIIYGTTWRSGIRHKLFGDPGCTGTLPTVENGYYNVSEETSCWGNPRDGAIATYHCLNGFDLRGPSFYRCRNGSWVPETSATDWSSPRCSNGLASQASSIESSLIVIALLASMLIT